MKEQFDELQDIKKRFIEGINKEMDPVVFTRHEFAAVLACLQEELKEAAKRYGNNINNIKDPIEAHIVEGVIFAEGKMLDVMEKYVAEGKNEL
jgi:hypothetical protein